MSYATGTCTGHIALLDALKTFLEAQGWATKRYATGDVYEYVAMGPGLTGTDEIYIGIQTYTNSDSQYYNWKLRGYTGYSSLLDFASQPGAISGTSNAPLLLTNGTIQYWFIVNSRRVIVIAKCGLSYECAYLGLIIPYAPESQLSYPLFIGGSHNSVSNSYTEQEFEHFSFWNPQVSSSGSRPQSTFLANNTWMSVVNRGGDGYGLVIHPYCGTPTSEESPSPTIYEFYSLRENIDGSFPVLPCILMSNYASVTRGVYGELDGVFGVPSINNVPEDTITIGSDTYIIIASAYRTSRRSYAAFKLE